MLLVAVQSSSSPPNYTKKKTALWRFSEARSKRELLLRLLEHHVLAELLAVLRKLDLALDFLLVLAAPIHLAGGLVLELNQSFL